jgi:formate/nitrite transporter FocA (FNT family)
MAFVSSGLEHSIANMYFIPAGLFTQGYITDPAAINAHLTWVTMWTQNIVIVTLGNIVGGMIFVGVIYWVAFRKEIAALK